MGNLSPCVFTWESFSSLPAPIVLQGCKSSPQKSRLLESGRRRHGVWIAIMYSYKLCQKMNLNFCANMAVFCRDSHKYFTDLLSHLLETVGAVILKILSIKMNPIANLHIIMYLIELPFVYLFSFV